MDLYNVQTGKKELINDPNALNNAILSGTHAFKKGTMVNIYPPNSDDRKELKQVPAENLSEAIKMGYRVQTQLRKNVDDYVEENSGLKGAAKVALGQFADEALMGVPETALDILQDPEEVAKREALKKEWEMTNTLAGLGGFGASLLYGGPLFKGAAAAGAKVTEKVAAALGARTAEGLSTRGLKGLAANIVSKAAGTGVEGAILSAPRAVTEAALGEPGDAAETIVEGVGAGALLGGGAVLGGALLKPLGKLAKAAYEKAGPIGEDSLKRLRKVFIGVPDEDIIHYTDMVKNDRHLNVPLKEDIKDLIDNAVLSRRSEVDAAAKIYQSSSDELRDAYRLAKQELSIAKPDIKLTEEIASALESEKSKLKELSDSAIDILDSAPGASLKRENIIKYLKDAEDTLKVGGEGKDIIIGESNKEAARAINQRIKELSSLPELVPLGTVKKVIKSIDRDIDWGYAAGEFNKSKDAALKSFRRSLSNDLRGFSSDYASTMDEISSRSDILSEMSGVFGTPEKALSNFAKIASGKDQLKKSVLDKFSAQTGIDWSAKLSELSDKKRLLDESRIKDIPEKLVPEFFAKAKDAEQKLYDIQQKYAPLSRLSPVRTQSLIQRQGFKNASVEDRRAIESLSEMTGTDFNQMIKDRNTYDSFSKERTNGSRRTNLFGSIGAAAGAAIGGPSGAAAGAGIGAAAGASMDVYAGKLVKSIIEKYPESSGILFAEQAIKRSAERLDKIPEILSRMSANKTIPSAGTSALYGTIRMTEGVLGKYREDLMKHENDGAQLKPPSFEDRVKALDELNKNTEWLISNPDNMAAKIAEITDPIRQQDAPKIADATATQYLKTMNYISANMPKPPKPKSIFKRDVSWKPNDYDLSNFEKKMDVIRNPYVVLKELEANTLTRAHMHALKEVYPGLHQKIIKRVFNSLANGETKLDYNKRLKLSLIMDTPLDDTLKSIPYYQQTWAQENQQMAASEADMSAPGEAGYKASVDLASMEYSDLDSRKLRRQQ